MSLLDGVMQQASILAQARVNEVIAQVHTAMRLNLYG